VRKAIQPSGGGDRSGKTTAGEGETAAVGEGTAVGEEAETAVGAAEGMTMRSGAEAGLGVEGNSLLHPVRADVRIVARPKMRSTLFALSEARKPIAFNEHLPL